VPLLVTGQCEDTDKLSDYATQNTTATRHLGGADSGNLHEPAAKHLRKNVLFKSRTNKTADTGLVQDPPFQTRE
jgi:hypothetical protein